jgi:hypothetical protein
LGKKDSQSNPHLKKQLILFILGGNLYQVYAKTVDKELLGSLVLNSSRALVKERAIPIFVFFISTLA